MAEMGYQQYDDYSQSAFREPMAHMTQYGGHDQYAGDDRDRERRRDRDRRRPRDRDRRRDRDRKGDWERERSRDRYSDEQQIASRDDSRLQEQNGPEDWSDSSSWGGDSQRSYDTRGQSNYNENNSRGSSYGRQSDNEQDRGRDGQSRGGGYMSNRSAHSGGYSENRTGMSGRVSWREEKPAATVLLKALPMDADEAMIREEVGDFAAYVKDIRLMRKKDTGSSRGFAFVEFHNVSDAQRWMEHNQGSLIMRNGHKVYMHYSNPRGSQGAQMAARQGDNKLGVANDWSCIMCGTHNFKKRDRCFKCNVSREVSETTGGVGGSDQVGTNPCNTLIFRGLDALTTEEKLIAALSQVTALTLKNVKIMLDSTGVSLGYAFVEMGSIRESTQLLETINRLNSPLEVDGKGVIISYAKNTFSTVMVSLNSFSQTQTGSAQWSEYYQQPGSTGTSSQAYYDQATGQYYDPATGQYYDYNTYFARQASNEDSSVTTQSDSTNAAAAVAQAAIQQAQAVKNYQKQTTTAAETETTTEAVTVAAEQQTYTDQKTELAEDYKYPVPDVSTYQYEETSGYYYDPLTGLYYDASSQYYYNAQTGQFLYWDAEKQTYLPTPTDGQTDAPGDKKKDKEKKEKGKFARKIAKDMEKWAKTLNAKKEKMNDFKRYVSSIDPSGRKESATADAGFAILAKGRIEPKKDEMLMPPPTLGAAASGSGDSPTGLVGDYGGDSEEEEDTEEDPMQNEEAKLLDWTKMACLLCKRQFPSKEGLQRHIQLSDLHKTKKKKVPTATLR